jgi:hypothetical protein
MSPAFDAKLPAGWFYSDPEQAVIHHAELCRELPRGHLLYGVPVEVVAHREGTDDILCRHVNDTDRFTVIHLSWLMREEIGPNHPTVEVDGNLDDFYAYERRFGID